MPSIFDALLDPDEQFADPIKRKAIAAQLRRQNAMGVLGQVMGLDATSKAGASLQDSAQTSLKQALLKQQAAKEAAIRKAERDQAQGNWQAEQLAQAGRHKDTMGLQYSQEERLRKKDEHDQGDWKVRLDAIGNPLGWYRDNGDFMGVDGSFFGAPRGGNTASVAPTGQPGPAVPTPMPSGGGGGGRGGPPAGPMQPPGGAPPPVPGPVQQPGANMLEGMDDARASQLRLGRIKGLPSEQQNKYGTAIAQRDRLPSLIQQVEANPQAFGLTKDIAQHIPGQPGDMGAVAQNITRSIQDKYRDPKEAQIRSRVYQEAYEVIHALAGAALSTGEANRILGFMPGPTDPPEKILANLRSAYAEANRTIGTLEGMAGIPEQIRSRLQELPQSAPPQVQSTPQGGSDEVVHLPPRPRKQQ